ncbi:MAG: hypothetical protein ACJAVV_002722 [Alphaproteobacteria bacterium]
MSKKEGGKRQKLATRGMVVPALVYSNKMSSKKLLTPIA